jgi:hypothetical protein
LVYGGEIPYLEMLTWRRQHGVDAICFAPVLNRRRLGEAYEMGALLV